MATKKKATKANGKKSVEEAATELVDTATDDDDQVKVEYFAKRLRVKLTSEERIAKATAHVGLLNERDNVVAELDAIKADFRARLKRLDERAGHLRRDVEDGTEERSVRCVEVRDYRRGIVLVKRTDSQEVIDERAMAERERQLELEAATESEPEGDGSEKGWAGMPDDEPDADTSEVAQQGASA